MKITAIPTTTIKAISEYNPMARRLVGLDTAGITQTVSDPDGGDND
jgi:hypothetical protein